MSGYTACALVLLLALLPPLVIASRGDGLDRLVGLELVGATMAVFLVVLAQATKSSYYLSVPLVLVPMSLAGTLVFTRLLGSRDDSE